MQAPCQLCGKKEATIHLTELDASGHPRELHACASCTQALGSALEDGPPPIASLLEHASAGTSSSSEGGETVTEPEQPCPQCGLEFSEYAANNLFGCAHDYLAFSEQVEALLARYHGATRHVGRAPARASHAPAALPATAPSPPAAPTPAALAVPPAVSERRRLEGALKEAVAKERYEEAAQLRDQLRQLGKDPG